jgi:hypothetical protein
LLKVQPDPPSEPADDEDSTLATDDALIAQVTQCLASITTQASKDHANALQESNEHVEAYAKVAAQDWTYYIKHLTVNIGRTSEPVHSHPPTSDPEDDDFVHIDLGPNKVFSRQTAMIYFNPTPAKWYLRVKGRNGLKVNGATLKKDDAPHLLSSGEVIEVGGIEMMFVLPANIGPLNIHDMYIQRIGHGAPPPSRGQRSSPAPELRHALPAPPSGDSSAQRNAGRALLATSQSRDFQQLIAPAPPDYKRPGTPPSAKTRTNVVQHKSPAYSSSGTMLMNPNDVDLSLDENKHIKPLFSYAQMITQAIISTQEQKLNLNGIYRYIMDNYAYYRNQEPGGWQVSLGRFCFLYIHHN